MAIEFVGSASTSVTTSFISATSNFSIATLTGGISSSPQAGDIVLLLRGFNNNITSSSTTGYTTLVFQSADYVLRDGAIYSGYKVLGSSSDTTISLFTPAQTQAVTIAMVFRGVHQTTPLDANTAFFYSGTGLPDPAAITTVTNNAVSVVLAASALAVTSVTSPSGYSASVVRGLSGIAAYACFKTIATAGTENPGAFGGITPSGATSNAAFAVTVALRPAVSAASGNVKVWNGASWVAKPVKVWNGSAWVTKPAKRWNGTAWVTTPY